MNTAITFNSGLIVPEDYHLESLSIFYNSVALPSLCTRYEDMWVRIDRTDNPKRPGWTIASILPQRGYEELSDFYAHIRNWDERYVDLFNSGVLVRASDPPDGPGEDWADMLWAVNPNVILPQILASRSIMTSSERLEDSSSIVVLFDQLAHFLRDDLEKASLYIADNNRVSASLLASVQANLVMKYLLPSINKLNPEQILEVREKVSDTREGFISHLHELSASVDNRLRGGESLSDIQEHAKFVLETQLFPDYYEFRRQLESERSGFWSKVLNRGAQALEIDAAMWSPKFFLELSKAISGATEELSEETKRLVSNRDQSFHLMRSIEQIERKPGFKS